ncbi:MAG: alkene reductase [Alphaproteobacteria bacterium]
MSLFSPYELGPISLANRVVMAPMTRSRALDNLPNALMADYYAQRASAGLIITEGTAPSPNGLGYPRIPGLFSADQVEGWRQVTDRVHAAGGRIIAQLMHVGRIGHPLNLPAGAEILAPSAVAAAGEMFTDQEGMKAHPTPRAMTEADIEQARGEFVEAATNAIAAGFDGVELHAANGYLLEQFLSPHTNQRTDGYGGSVAARGRFVAETAEAVAKAIGADRVGIRLSPHSGFNDMPAYDETVPQYVWLAERLKQAGLLYLHLVLGAERIPEASVEAISRAFDGRLILNGGFDRESAEAALTSGQADLIAFGVPFIANPDLVARMRQGKDLAAPRQELFYSPGAEGYVDYRAAA